MILEGGNEKSKVWERPKRRGREERKMDGEGRREERRGEDSPVGYPNRCPGTGRHYTATVSTWSSEALPEWRFLMAAHI